MLSTDELWPTFGRDTAFELQDHFDSRWSILKDRLDKETIATDEGFVDDSGMRVHIIAALADVVAQTLIRQYVPWYSNEDAN